VYVPASAFILYFVLLLFCDIRRPVIDAAIASTDEGLVVRSVTISSAVEAAGVRSGDRIVSVDGRPVHGRLDWLAAELMFRLNRPLALRIERGGASLETALVLAPAGADYWLRPEGLMLAVVRLVQAVTLAAALLVWWRRSTDLVGWLAGWVLATTAVFTVVPPYRLSAVWSDLPAPLAQVLWAPRLSALAVGAVMFSFFAVFPRQWLRRPGAWVLAWTPMALALAWHVRFEFDILYRPGLHRDESAMTFVLLPVTAAYVIGGLALLVYGYRTLQGEVERRRTRVVVASALAALLVGLPVVIAYWARPTGEVTESLFASPLFAVGTIWMLIFPLGFTYAILRHRLFDVPAIIRRGVQYALARRALVSILPLATVALASDVLIHRNEAVSEILARRGWIYAGLMALAIVARVRRDAWLDGMDRRFFREKYSAHHVLRAVAADIRRAGGFEAAARDVVTRIGATLHPTVTAMLLRQAGARVCEPVAVSPSDAHMASLDADSRLLALLRLLGKPLETPLGDRRGLAGQLPHDAQQWLEVNRVELLIPVALTPRGPDAVLVLGPRRSEEPYEQDDKDLLQGIADSLALVLEGSVEGDDEAPMMECPACGRCEPPRTWRCPADSSTLIAARIPRRLAQRYLVERRLARGGMATVYEAVDTQLGRRVAVKVLRDELVENAAAVSRFEREARLIAALNHPNIVVVHDFGVTGSGAYLVMEFLEGTTLRDRLGGVGRLGLEEARMLLRGMAAALEAAHARGIVHRDLKPENVFIVQQGSTQTPKILDFGIARLLSELPTSQVRSLTRAGQLFGTPDYMAPEQTAWEKPSIAWDVWALAVVAYEMITGGLPDEEGERDLPPALRAFFARALSFEPDDRPAGATALVERLEQAMSIGYGAAHSS
jgi:tRNA A-37 threonylcarbamoyl transferase component Bud32